MCVFYQGPGLLVSDDDTAFHGEFSDDWTVNGKVESTLSPLYLCALVVCHAYKDLLFICYILM